MRYSTEDVKGIFEKFGQLSVMVIGDAMVDSYLWGKVSRISPEAPVPVVEVTKRVNRLGGAANVALNLKALGAETYLCSVVGKDDKSKVIQDLLHENSLTSIGTFQSGKRITTTKFRVIGSNTQMLRVDEEIDTMIDKAEQIVFFNLIKSIIEAKTINAIIFQDYDKGVITPDLIKKVVDLAQEKVIPIVVDPKRRNFLNYHHVDLFKPNLKELFDGMGTPFVDFSLEKIRKAVRALHKKLHIPIVMTTLSDEGIFISRHLLDGSFSDHHIPAHLRSIADVSGAGDTVVSVASLALAAGFSDYEIAAISNLAGGLVCESVGVVPVDKEKLMSEIISKGL